MENPVELAATTLSIEIHNVFRALESILPDLSDYPLKGKDLRWMHLERISSNRSTIRDYILQSYSTEQLGESTHNIKMAALICPLSFDITSNARTFEIDHFYPKDDILQALEHLESNQPLLLETKKQLKSRLSIDHDLIKSTQIVNKLIPENAEQTLSVTGLKHIYFNCPQNLWPISGPTNSSKGKKASLNFAIEKIFESLMLFPGEPIAGKMLDETALSMGLTRDPALSTSDKIAAMSEALVLEFDALCHESNLSEAGYILPSYYSHTDNQYVSMLAFFQKSPVGNLATNYARATAQQSLRAMRFAKTIAVSLISDDRREQNLAWGFATASKTVDRAARRTLRSMEDVSSDSDNPLDEVSKEAMRFSADEIHRIVAKADAANAPREEELDHNPVQTAKRKLHDMQGGDAEKDQTHVLPSARDGDEPAVDSSRDNSLQ